MEISKNEQAVLLELIHNRLSQKNHELEAKFKDLNLDEFSKVAKYLKTFYTLQEEQDVLDISTVSGNIRASLHGKDTIQEYCRTNNVSLIENVHLMKKKLIKNADLEKYRCKVSLQEESPVTDVNIEQHMKTITNKEKTFRLKRRWSCITEDNMFKIDLTLVKQGTNATSFIRSNLLKQSDKYELEIEYIYQKQAKTNDVLEALLKHITELLQVVNETNGYLVNKYEEFNVMKGFLRLTRQDTNSDYMEIKNNSRRFFVGPQPTTIQQNNLLDPDIDIVSIKKGYTVTDKADGTRGLVYVDTKGYLYILNNRLEAIPMGTTSKSAKDSLYDAEILFRNNGRDVYVLCFDAYYVNGQEITHLPLMVDDTNAGSRLKEVNKFVSGGFSSYRKTVNCHIHAKKFYSVDGDEVFKTCAKILDESESFGGVPVGDTVYKIDGLIFTPKSLGVGCMFRKDKPRISGSWTKLIKWKPESENSIDFMVKMEAAATKVDINGVPMKVRPLKLFVGYNINDTPITATKYIKQRISNTSNTERQYISRLFVPEESSDVRFSTCHVQVDEDGNIKCLNNDPIKDGNVVECSWIAGAWVPLRIRPDKVNGNDYNIAMDIWKSINFPVTVNHIKGTDQITTRLVYDDSKYYMRNIRRDLVASRNLADFHNWIKNKVLLHRFRGIVNNVLDIGCGPGGDIFKWKENGFDVVVGVDLYEDNITNPYNGAYKRLIKHGLIDSKFLFMAMDGSKKFDKEYFDSLGGDSSMLANIVWGYTKPTDKFLQQFYNIGGKRFDMISCQFAIHYFFKSMTSLKTFASNVAENLNDNGYFIGTCFDGHKVSQLLEDKKLQESIVRTVDDERVVWAIKKTFEEFNETNPEENIGKEIEVYIDSINKKVPEYLVDYNLLVSILEKHDIFPLNSEECQRLGLQMTTGTFDELYDNAINKNSKVLDTSQLDAPLQSLMRMSDQEKDLSFLNRWFIFRKKKLIQKPKAKAPRKKKDTQAK